MPALDANDPDHPRCGPLVVEATEDLVVPGLVLAELGYWCHARLDDEIWLVFLEDHPTGLAARVLPDPAYVDSFRHGGVQCAISGPQWRFQGSGECHIGGVVGGELVPHGVGVGRVGGGIGQLDAERGEVGKTSPPVRLG